MDSVDTLVIFLGWCSVINVGVLLFSTLMLVVMKGTIIAVHSKMFGVDPQNLPTTYFNYLANYKVAIFIFNLAPYCALRLMS